MIGIILGLVLFIVSVIYFATRRGRVGNVNLFHWFILGMGIFYGLFFSVVLLLLMSGYETESTYWILNSSEYYLIYFVLIALFIFTTFLGFFSIKTKKNNEELKILNNLEYKKIFSFILILFLIAIIAIYLFTKARGGLLGNIVYSKAFGVEGFDEHNKWSFLKPFLNLAPIVTCFLLGFCLSKNSFYSKLLFFISLVPASYVLLFASGRLTLILYLVAPLLIVSINKNAKHIKIVFFIIVGLFFLIYGVSLISDLLDWKSRGAFSVFLISELSFPFYAFFANLHADTDGIRFYQDILMYPFYAFPERFTGITFNVNTINTAIIKGYTYTSSFKETSKPIDLITFGWLQGGVFGIAIFGYIYGVFLKVINNLLMNITTKPIRISLFALVIIRMMYGSFYYMSPMGFFNKNIAILGVLILTSLFYKWLNKKNASYYKLSF